MRSGMRKSSKRMENIKKQKLYRAAKPANRKYLDEVITDTHVYFWGGVYSQWTHSPFYLPIVRPGESKAKELLFESGEQWMMANKAVVFEDREKFDAIMASTDPYEMKIVLGRHIKNFDEQKWYDESLDIVTKGNIAKFAQNPKLYKVMLSHGDRIIVEGSPEDRIWGVGLLYYSKEILDEKNWKYEVRNGVRWENNRLGIACMRAREFLRDNL